MTTDQVTTAKATRAGTRGVWAMRDRPAVVWLVLALGVAAASAWLPDATWLLAHLLLLGALTHAAVVWSAYFAQALLKTPVPEDERARQNRRLVLLMVGTTFVLVGVPTTVWPLTVAGATLAAAAVCWHGVVWWRRLRTALPGRFRITIRYYVAAAACMPVGAAFGAALARGVDDEAHGQLVLGHIGVMVLGWIGLTITGTLVTFWPTILRTRIDPRAEILARQALPGFVASILIVVAGALLGATLLAAAGLVGYAGALAWWGALSCCRPVPGRHASSPRGRSGPRCCGCSGRCSRSPCTSRARRGRCCSRMPPRGWPPSPSASVPRSCSVRWPTSCPRSSAARLQSAPRRHAWTAGRSCGSPS